MPPIPRKPTHEEQKHEQRVRAARLALFDRMLKDAMDG
jgi:hypothetical protein